MFIHLSKTLVSYLLLQRQNAEQKSSLVLVPNTEL